MSEIFPGVKQISQTGNEMYGQGGFPVGIHTTDAGWLADPADTMLLAGRDPVIKEVSVGMTGEEAAVYNVSGTPPLSLTNSLGRPLTAWSVELSPYQEGTGDPAPDNVRPIHGTDKVKWFVEESYDPTATPKAVLTLPQTVYTGTVWSGGGESTLTKVKITSFTGSWGVTTNGYVAYASVPNAVRDPTAVNLCDKFVFHNSSYTSAPVFSYGCNNGANTTWTFILPSTVHNLSEAKQWIIDNGGYIEFTAKLATPTTFAVPSVTIPTPRGTATTWATAEDGTVESMEVTYVGKS